MKTRNKFCKIIGMTMTHSRNLIGFLVLTYAFSACTPSNTVKGYIEGLSNDTIIVVLVSLTNFGEQEPVQDTIFAKNGRFVYVFPNNGAYGIEFSFPQFYVPRPGGGYIRPNNGTLLLFTESNNRISFKSDINSAGLCNFTVFESKLNRDYSIICNQLFEIDITEIEEQLAIEQGMVDKNKDLEDTGWAKRRERLSAHRALFGNFIRTNLDNPLSAFLLFRQPLDSVGKYYNKLGESARNSIFRNMLDGEMERYKEYMNVLKAQEEIVVGSMAPDFSLEGVDGKLFTLSSLCGKYVIIDFWGSWCGPCVFGIPKMKSIYEKYRDKLEILGVACNEQSVNTWRDAVKQHELPWINVYNDKSSGVNVIYGIDAYPTKIVIDREGKILIREKGEGENFYKTLEYMLD